MSYHNTCGIEDTRDYEQKALSQDERLLMFFESMPFGELFSPSELHSAVLPDAPLTSTRRALSNLTAAERLVKTDMMVQGEYGRPEGLWRLAEPVQEKLF